MTQERSWVIGSAADCDVVVKDPKVSRHHCRLTQTGQQFILEDLLSTNGTFVNGQRVRSKLVVTTTDDITLGRKVIMPWPESAAKSLPTVIRIGRDTNNDVILEFPTVSAHHARITVQGDVITIEDLNSTNGTAVGSLSNKIRTANIQRTDTLYLGSLSLPASLVLDNRGNITRMVNSGTEIVAPGEATHERTDNGEPKPQHLQTREDSPEGSPSTKIKTISDSNDSPGLAGAARSKVSDSQLSQDVPEGIARIRNKLISLTIVSESEWLQAVQLAGSENELGPLLYHLGQMTSSWRFGNNESLPVLSDYQQQKILADEIDDLRMDNYVILDRIAGGGMGEVFKARNLKLSRLEAIKTIKTDGLKGSAHADARQRFKREARILAALSHPNISTVYDSGYCGENAYIAMEYISGQDMKTIVEETIEEGQLVPIDWAVTQIIKVAEALSKAHALNVIHRDIKPGNIMIAENKELKVLDMGIARIKDPSSGIGGSSILTITSQSIGLGTPEVMPPEQWRDATSVTPASDIYSLGCTFFYMLTGEMPFIADNLGALMEAHARETPRSICEYRDDCPRALDQVIQKMLAKKPEDRYASAEELIEALKNINGSDEPFPPWLIPAAVATVLTIVGVAALAFFW